jgi:glycosyltransferase involved in cell wall biosynthesis
MNDSPLVSVVIAAYNASRWIAETLESVLAQNFTDFEIILVDDGSTDDTAQVVAGYGERVCCIHRSNGGGSSARNVGIRAARGEYIAFVDADDLWAKEKLRLQVDLLKRTGLAWVYCDAIAFDDKSGRRLYRFGKANHQYDGDILKSLFHACFIPSPTPVIRKSIFENIGYFSEDLNIGEDWDMWLKIAAYHPIGLVSVPLAYYRVHSTNETGKHDPQAFLQGQLTSIGRAITREPARLGPLKNRAMANCYIGAGRRWASRGRLQKARQMFRSAIQLSPGLVEGYINWAGCLVGGLPLRVTITMSRWVLSKY